MHLDNVTDFLTSICVSSRTFHLEFTKDEFAVDLNVICSISFVLNNYFLTVNLYLIMGFAFKSRHQDLTYRRFECSQEYCILCRRWRWRRSCRRPRARRGGSGPRKPCTACSRSQVQAECRSNIFKWSNHYLG